MLKFVATALFAMAPIGAVSAANLVTNGSFETPGGGGIQPFANGSLNITGWEVIGPANSDIATIGNGVGNVIADDGVTFLDLTGTKDGQSIYGGVAQTIATIDGQAYTLTFALGNYSTNPGATGVLVNAGSTNGTFILARPDTGFLWQSLSLDFIGSAGGATTISFLGTDGFFFTGLDNVGVESVTAAVPEPASWAMLIAGFGLTGAAMRRQRVAAARSAVN